MSRKKCHYILLLFIILICCSSSKKFTTAQSVLENLSNITEKESQFLEKASTISPTSVTRPTSQQSTKTLSTSTVITRLYLNTFNLTNISYSNSIILVDYLIKADYSLNISIEVNCRSKDYDQSWSNSIRTNTFFNKSTSGKIILLPVNQTAAPGSLIECRAAASSSESPVIIDNNNSTLARVLIDPPPIFNLVATSLNEKSIDLTWSVPAINTGTFNTLEVKCFLNDDFIGSTTQNTLNKTITDINTDQLKITNLIPGALYNCFVTTLRIVDSLVSRTDSNIAACMTKLGKPVLENSLRIEEDNSIHFKLIPPSGYYDFFKVQLNIPLPTHHQSRLLREISAENFTYTPFSTEVSFSNIEPGQAYEVWSETYRTNLKYSKFPRSSLTKLMDAFIIIPPGEVVNLNVFATSEKDVFVSWTKPAVGVYDEFLVYIYETENPNEPIRSSPIRTLATNLTIEDLRQESVYLFQVVACSKLTTRCDKFSKPVARKFSFNTRMVEDLIVGLSSNEKFGTDLGHTSSAFVEWSLNSAVGNLCDMSRFHVQFTDVNKSLTQKCVSDALNLANRCENYKSLLVENSKYPLCPNNQLECLEKPPESRIACTMSLNRLNLNTVYTLRISVISLAGEYEWPYVQSKQLIYTDVSPPSDYETLKVGHNAQVQSGLKSGYALNILKPVVDQNNGRIIEAYLFLVNIGAVYEAYVTNTSILYSSNTTFQIDKINQDYLNTLITEPACSANETTIFRPCLVKKSNFLEKSQLILIGELGLENLSGVNLTDQIYENVTSLLVRPFNVYQLFYVFKISGIKSDSFILFATNPSEIIKTLANKSFDNSRNGLDLWIVVLISVLSIILLIVALACLVVMLVIRYRPSKFQKAVVAQQGRRSMSKIKSLEKLNEYGHSIGACGVFYDFIEPREFSRDEMTNIWLVKHANGDLIFDEEYRNLPDFRNLKTSYASQASRNEIKNRFLDIKAYDESRVILTGANGLVSTTTYNTLSVNRQRLDTNSQLSVDKSIISSMSTSTSSNSSNSELQNNYQGDYINANFVQGYSHDKKFIATQGPKRETINDFWRMINQYKVSAVVMLTKLVEKGVERCTQYWPEKVNSTEQYGDFEVTLKEQQKCGDYIKRIFELVQANSDVHSQFKDTIILTPGSSNNKNIKRPLTVTQYYYPEWPDKDTPSTDPMSILHLIRDVNANHLHYQYPIVVHCSAGVGRTGTYITLDAMMEKINTEGRINIFGFISKIRERRQYLVQTSKQYVFIHEALYEYCLYGFTDVESWRLENHYKSLKELRPVKLSSNTYQNINTAKTQIQVEFDKVSNAFVPNCQAREAFTYENKARNRYLDNICYDENRVKLSGLNGSSFINATKLKSYEVLNNELIVTQDPMANTVFEFWKMISEHDCHFIVALNSEFEKEVDSVYWPTETEKIKEFECEDLKLSIELISQIGDRNKPFSVREFVVTEKKYDGSRKMNVTQFFYNETWPEDRLPATKAGFVDLVRQVYAKTNQVTNSCIVVHGHGGASNCSVFCALSMLLETLRSDQHVDVCRTVKKLKTQRPHMVATMQQYEFIYLCLIDLLKDEQSETVGDHSIHNDSIYFRSPNELVGTNI